MAYECGEGLVCVDLKCVTPPQEEPPKQLKLNDVCSGGDEATGVCPSGTRCLREAATAPYLCQKLPEAGAPCLSGYCADTAWCAPGTPKTCTALPGAGEPCVPRANVFLGDRRCEAGTYCNNPEGKCAVKAAIGATCGQGDGDSCEGDDVVCQGNDGFRCHKYGGEGEPCSTPYELCVRGTTCTGGFCRPGGAQDIFQNECRR